VFYDALVGEGVLALASPKRLVSVGKRSGRHSKAQGDINELLIAAKAGQRVVRLKGATRPSLPQRRGNGYLAKGGVVSKFAPALPPPARQPPVRGHR
jgi:uroporphyrin-III C-methyltransferase